MVFGERCWLTPALHNSSEAGLAAHSVALADLWALPAWTMADSPPDQSITMNSSRHTVWPCCQDGRERMSATEAKVSSDRDLPSETSD